MREGQGERWTGWSLAKLAVAALGASPECGLPNRWQSDMVRAAGAIDPGALAPDFS